METDRLELLALSGLMVILSLISVGMGIVFLRRSKKAEQMVIDQVKSYSELLKNTPLSWIGQLYATIFTQKITKFAVFCLALGMIIYGGLLVMGSLIGIIVALFMTY